MKPKCRNCKTEKREKKSAYCQSCNLKLYPVKICPKCKQTKPITDFYRNKTQKDGLCCYCKICHSKSKYPIQRKQAYYEAQDIVRNYRTAELCGTV